MTRIFLVVASVIAGLFGAGRAVVGRLRTPAAERLESAFCTDSDGLRCSAPFRVRRWLPIDLPGEHRDDLQGTYEMLGVWGPTSTVELLPGGAFVRDSSGCTGRYVDFGIARGRGDRLELRWWDFWDHYEVLVVRWHAGHAVLLRERELEEFEAQPSIAGGYLVRLRPGETARDFE